MIKKDDSDILSKRSFNSGDHKALTENGSRYEILDGDLRMANAPNISHQRISGHLYYLIRTFLEETGSGEVLTAPIELMLQKDVVLQPDLLVVHADHKDILAGDNITEAPDFVIEIISSTSAEKDFGKKKELYERFGVLEYWIINPVKEEIDVYIRKEGTFVLAQKIFKGEIRSLIFEGLKIELDQIFQQT